MKKLDLNYSKVFNALLASAVVIFATWQSGNSNCQPNWYKAPQVIISLTNYLNKLNQMLMNEVKEDKNDK